MDVIPYSTFLERVEKAYGAQADKQHIILGETKDSISSKKNISRENYKTVFKLSELEKILEEAEKKGAAKALKELKQLLELNF